MSGQQAFIVVPVPTQGESHDGNTTSQHIHPNTQEQIVKIAQGAINGDSNGSHDSSLTRLDQSSGYNDSHSARLNSGQVSKQQKNESGEKENVQESAIVKNIIDNPRGLSSLINWENPRLTLTSLTTVVTLLLASRYFHLMQWVFKALSVILGVVSAVEFATRSTSGKSITMRVKPQPYYTIPESTLNLIFTEMREATQFIVVQAQKLIFGENLSNTFRAFAVSFSLYWLIKLFTLWQLAVLVVPFVYTVPLILSPQSKQPVRDVADTAARKASAMAAGIKDKAQDLDLQQTNGDAADKLSSTVSNLKGKVEGTAKNATNKISSTANESLSSHSISNAGSERIPSNTHSTIDGGASFESNDKPHHTTNTPATSDSHMTSSSNGQGDLFSQNSKPHATHTYELAPPEGGNISATKINPGSTNGGYPSTGEALFGASAAR